jgi:hypothetical protein
MNDGRKCVKKKLMRYHFGFQASFNNVSGVHLNFPSKLSKIQTTQKVVLS